MRRRAMSHEDQLLRLGAALTGTVLMASAALAGELARDHMVVLGAICGAGPDPHCGWCFGAAGLVLAGLAAFGLAIRPRALQA